jgi:hypothetical protein
MGQPKGQNGPEFQSGNMIMTELLIFVRNLVLAAIFALIGLEFAPKAPEQTPDDQRDSKVTLSLLG